MPFLVGPRRAMLINRQLTFEQQMAALPGLFAYYKLTETGGMTADNIEGTAALDGTYENSPTLSGSTFPIGDAVATFSAANSRVALPTTDFLSAFNWSKGWYIGWGNPPDSIREDSTRHTWFTTKRSSTTEMILIFKDLVDYRYRTQMRIGGNLDTMDWAKVKADWTMIALVWDQPSDYIRLFFDGVLFTEVNSIVAPTLDPLSSANAFIGWSYSTFGGGMGHHAFGAGQVLTESRLNTLYEAVIPTTIEINYAGDSKTDSGDYWPTLLEEALATASGDRWRERPHRMAVTGYKVSDLATYLQANLSSTIGNPAVVLITIGTNDLNAHTAENDFKADLTACIDAYLARFPATTIYIAKPYRNEGEGSFDEDALAMAGWIDDVIATYESGVAVGHNENGWFKDDLETYSDDGIHYNAAGVTEVVNQWMTILGY